MTDRYRCVRVYDRNGNVPAFVKFARHLPRNDAKGKRLLRMAPTRTYLVRPGDEWGRNIFPNPLR